MLGPASLEKLSRYLGLLLHWNRKVNLTALKDPRTIVRRLFAESLYAVNVVELKGRLVDVGSGAGFPGLALKLAAPDLRVTLIEARQKKCAFLKEVAQQCGFSEVEVVAELFQSWAARPPGQQRADIITTRAVDVSPELLQTMKSLLAPDGRLVLFTTARLAAQISKDPDFKWSPFRPYPSDPENGLQLSAHPIYYK